MQRLAQAHIVREAGSRAPCGKAGRPAEAVSLVVPEFRLHRRGHLGIQCLGIPELLEPIRPVAVGGDRARFLDQRFHGRGSRGVKPQALAMPVRVVGEFVDALLEAVRQGQELLVPDQHEATVGVLGLLQQIPEADDQVVV